MFRRAKALRNMVGHGAQTLTLGQDWDRSTYFYSVAGAMPAHVPDPLTPEVFRDAAVECQWLVGLLDHLGNLGGLRYFSMTGEEMEMLEPPPLPLPLEWDPFSLSRAVPKGE